MFWNEPFLLSYVWEVCERQVQYSSLHLAVSDPAADGKGVGVSPWRLHFHLAVNPGLLWEKWKRLFVKLNQRHLPKGSDGMIENVDKHAEKVRQALCSIGVQMSEPVSALEI